MSTLVATLVALGLAIGLVAAGEVIRARIPGLRAISLPGAVLGGAIGLLLGPQVLAWDRHLQPTGTGAPGIYDLVAEFPGMFINVVFAALMLGRRLDPLGVIWRRARPQIVMGHVYAWGQYVVGFLLTALVILPVLGGSLFSAPLIAIGFQGGHGTAAGLQQTFESLGFPDGKTVAYAVATFGIVLGAVVGPVVATVLSRREPISGQGGGTEPSAHGGCDEESHDDDTLEFSPLTGQLTLHLALLGLVILGGWGVLRGLGTLERLLRGEGDYTALAGFIPLFSVVLLVGLLVQWILQKTGLDTLFQRPLFDKVSAFALDMVVVSALATLSLAVVGENGWIILVLCLGGMVWNGSVFFLLGPRVYPRPWYPYALGDLGGGTATTATGLLLLRIADPEQRTRARQAYVEKQPFYEPFMGGGLVTAFALPVTAAAGAWACLAVAAVILIAWIGFAAKIGRASGDSAQ